MIINFRNLIVEENVDIFIGYNILKFDWDYLLVRAGLLGITFKILDISRIPDIYATEDKMKWSSSAYGVQEANFVNAHGRVNVDVLLEIQRNYKLQSYSLDVVSKFFLKEQKEDVSASQLFMVWRFYEFTREKKKEGQKYSIVRRNITSLFPPLKISGFLSDYCKKIRRAKSWSEIRKIAKELLTITGYYCIIDSVLPIDLVNKLNLWLNMEASSNIMNVPSSYLHTRGQQIKVYAQLYATAKPEGYVIPYSKYDEDKEKKGFMGAVVIEAKPGVYMEIELDDFESLYPSEMIANNICYTTFLNDAILEHKVVPDEECNIITWSQHVGCSCGKDKVKRKTKVKKEKILCDEICYRFRKVKYYEEDGKFTTRHEGVMPKLERRLLAERKLVKKQMWRNECTMNMHTGKATKEDIKEFEKAGITIIEKGTLTDEEEKDLKTKILVLNANQLALKILCNSAYGFLGVRNGGILPFIQGAGAVTAMGRKHLIASSEYVKGKFGGMVVYGDTDSIMVTYPNLTEEEKLENPFDRSARVVKAVTHYLKCQMLNFDVDTKLEGITKFMYDSLPINLQQESRFKKMILLTKKRYMATLVNREGKIIGKIKKGTVMARRDNCQYLKKVYEQVEDAVFNDQSLEEMQDIILNSVKDLLYRQYNVRDLVIYKAIGKFEKYAKKDAEGNVLGKNIKGDENGIKVIGAGQRTSSDNPLDWYYEKPPAHVSLALKMSERGEKVPPNTRMEYIFSKFEPEKGQKIKQSDKIEDYTYYMENKAKIEIDIFYYIERQLVKPISELLSLTFGDKIARYKSIKHEGMEIKQRLDKVFEKLPTSLCFDISKKKGYRNKVLYFLNHYMEYEDCKIDLGQFKKTKRGKLVSSINTVFPDEVFDAKEACTDWYMMEKMKLYFHSYGIGLGKLKQKRKKKYHPFFMDILQTIQRHEEVIDQLHTIFNYATQKILLNQD